MSVEAAIEVVGVGTPIVVVVGATSKFTVVKKDDDGSSSGATATTTSDRDNSSNEGDANTNAKANSISKKLITVKNPNGTFQFIPKTEADSDCEKEDPPKWGLGGALALPFAKKGYNIVLMGRRMEILEEVQQEIELAHDQWWKDNKTIKENAVDDRNNSNDQQQQQQQQQRPRVLSVLCDVTDDTMVQQAFEKVNTNIGALFPKSSFIDLIIYNVAPPYPPGFKFQHWGEILQAHQIDTNNMSFQVDTLVNGLVRVCKQPNVIPAMIERKRGCLLIAGESCCNLHGGQEFGAVAPARAAMRSLTQSMFRSYGPQGIHVCNINIGGLIDTPRTRTWSVRPKLTNPHEIAGQFYNIYQQPPTVWSYELQITPGFSAREVDMRM